jgi:hypothetical protein
MYGNEMMVAPVLDKGALPKKYILPQGEWIHFFTKKKYSGNQTDRGRCAIWAATRFYKIAIELARIFQLVNG